MVFESYWNDKCKYDENHKIEMCELLPMNNSNFNLSILKNNIDNTDNMNDTELRKFIYNSFDKILNSIFTSKEAAKYINKFQDIKFLDAFIDVTSDILNKNMYLDRIIVVRINTICYHYITAPDNVKNNAIIMRMINLSDLINRREKPKLLGLGLSNNLASMLLIARNSDINLEVCVKRVNFTLITQHPSLMSEKMLEDILRILYNVFSEDFIKVFEYIMFDVSERIEGDESTYWITDDISEVDSTLNLVILNIVEQLPNNMIRNILLNYTESYNIVNHDKRTRFSLRTISNDYSRIKYIVDMLMYNENIIVP